MLLNLVIYFIAGVLQDFLLTLNWRYVAKNKPLPAMVFSFLTTLVALTVFYNIVSQLDPRRSLLAIIIYSLGIGTGTYLAMKFKPDLK